MKFSKVLFCGAIAVVLLSCSKESSRFSESKGVKAEEEKSLIIQGQVIARFSEDFINENNGDISLKSLDTKASSQLNTAIKEIGGVKLERLFEDGGEFEERHREAGLHLWYRITFDSPDYSPEEAVKILEGVSGISHAEVEREMQLTSCSPFNDPMFYNQWDLYNDASLGKNYKSGIDINVVPVWNNFTVGSSEVIVSVLDYAPQTDHEDLDGVVVPAGPNGSKCFGKDKIGYTLYPGDHGTHVSGTIAAINNNGKGICGIAGGNDGNGGVRILSCQIFLNDSKGNRVSGDAYDAMVWGADHGAVISSNSWGYYYEKVEDARSQNAGNLAMASAIDYFINYAGIGKNGEQTGPMKGGVVIFAAGNEGCDIGWPAAYDGDGKCIAVGAVSSSGGRASYSNYGDWVDICAPGGDSDLGPTILSTIPTNSYKAMEGTSMACPHVSGVAALIVSYYGGPGFTNDMLVERLIGGSNKSKVSSNLKIGGLLDAYGSMTYGNNNPPDKVTDVEVSVISNSISCSFRHTVSKESIPYGYVLYVSESRDSLENLVPSKVPSSVKQASITCPEYKTGDTVTLTIPDLEFGKVYYTTVLSYSYWKVYSGKSEIQEITSLANHDPVISFTNSDPIVLKAHEILDLDFSVNDPDGHTVELEVNTGSEAVVCSKLDDNNYGLHFVGKNDEPGDYEIVITAKDQYGGGCELKIPYTLLPNHAPTVSKTFENISMDGAGKTETFNLGDYISDEDGETLTYTVNYSQKNVAHVLINNGVLTVSSLDYGLTDITIKAVDACGASASFTFKALVRDGSRPVDIYPVPVTDILYVRPIEAGEVTVKISNPLGAVVYDEKKTASPFEPLAIDVKDFPGGVYSIEVISSTVNYKTSFAKL